MSGNRKAQLGRFWLSQRPRSPFFYITWFDNAAKQTKRISTGTGDLRVAELKLAEHVTLQAELRDVTPEKMPLATVLLRYWDEHGKHLASSDTAKPALRMWSEFWGEALVSDLTVKRQEQFLAWLKAKGFKNSYVSRVLVVGRAALNRAWKRQEITSAPFIIDEKDRSDEEEAYRMTKAQMAKLIIGARDKQPHLFMFIILSLNTLGRPGAILDLGPDQVDLTSRLIDLNPRGKRRTKKGRPVVPITQTILPFLANGVPIFEHPLSAHGKAVQRADKLPARYVNWCGKPIACIRKSFTKLVADLGLPSDITPYSLRHTMATELRARGVPWEEIKGMLGHKMPGVTEKYAKYGADYLGAGSAAIDDYFSELGVPLTCHMGNRTPVVVPIKPLKIKEKIGAGEEDRTLDIHLGKVALYR